VHVIVRCVPRENVVLEDRKSETTTQTENGRLREAVFITTPAMSQLQTGPRIALGLQLKARHQCIEESRMVPW
jgi:hypothetical protein